jgi:hypothetical protein
MPKVNEVVMRKLKKSFFHVKQSSKNERVQQIDKQQNSKNFATEKFLYFGGAEFYMNLYCNKSKTHIEVNRKLLENETRRYR